jgi:hypothetical protein
MGGCHGSEPMSPIIMNQSGQGTPLELILIWLPFLKQHSAEYELNRYLWCLIAQSVISHDKVDIPVAFFFKFGDKFPQKCL